jgi:superfamily II DNA or RNA helicase
MPFSEAIQKKYICDYRIWLPSIHEDNSELNTELSIYNIDDTIKAKCKYFYSCLLNQGSKKCIIYCINTDELNNMILTMNKLNDFYCLEFETLKITSKTSYKSRDKIIKNFSNNKKIQLLFSIRILDECIDIVKCDFIYITYPSESKIRTIQRICRCLRKDDNQFKIGNIFIFCNQYSEILETLSGIKEYDVFFQDKICINSNNFYNKSNGNNLILDKTLIKKYCMGCN